MTPVRSVRGVQPAERIGFHKKDGCNFTQTAA